MPHIKKFWDYVNESTKPNKDNSVNENADFDLYSSEFNVTPAGDAGFEYQVDYLIIPDIDPGEHAGKTYNPDREEIYIGGDNGDFCADYIEGIEIDSVTQGTKFINCRFTTSVGDDLASDEVYNMIRDTVMAAYNSAGDDIFLPQNI